MSWVRMGMAWLGRLRWVLLLLLLLPPPLLLMLGRWRCRLLVRWMRPRLNASAVALLLA